MIHDAQVHLCQRCYAVILAGGRGTRLGPLTDRRAKPGVPFGGKLKIIDFALSNCVNSGIRRIGVLTQYKAQSLIRHVEHGWHFLAGSLGEFVDVAPAQQQTGEAWYAGTADAVWQNRDLLRESRPRHVLVLAGDHVYKMDYARMLAEHVASGAPASVACLEVPLSVAPAFGVLLTDAQQRVVAFQEKPACPEALAHRPGLALASMGIYVFDADFLFAELERDAHDPASSHDFGHDLIPSLLPRVQVHAHRYADSCMSHGGNRPYWRDVGTVDAYWAANMDLLEAQPELDLHDDGWPILSQQRQLPPAKFIDALDDDRRDLPGEARQSLVSSGCVVHGARIRRSILFPKVRIGPGSRIDDSLLLPNVAIGRAVRLRRVIIDKHCHLPDGFEAGLDPTCDRARGFHVTPGGVTLVTAAMLGQEGHYLD
ncbi:MAG TPA: glucose-1-phosphate adenylyltransferase [Burkholderiaceae bacterium]|nr:glucose-1-phosphate adenylyltransferase [Burkholderiaceae bacterium]HMX10052.1 glucose-1-phosphate adenylyltransferase [Burkholderiaceae bacterium]HMY98944.1 glucose-1-phosphate adenylyltransferase [Burkholderiaceae bacterium]HNB44256.1 glucose-1-phosphate adenylyltransferase [Burkholderiaceae bacterium]HNG79088.1 glucose-1-phosphate adenylyltransferase [Burkholderiaceae bacterium]